MPMVHGGALVTTHVVQNLALLPVNVMSTAHWTMWRLSTSAIALAPASAPPSR